MPIVNGTTYHSDTPDAVIKILEDARASKRQIRLRFYYGDQKTGKTWEDGDVCYVGRSTGPIMIPLVIHRKDSTGGAGMLDDCIVAITPARWEKGERVLYLHPKVKEIPTNVYLRGLGIR